MKIPYFVREAESKKVFRLIVKQLEEAGTPITSCDSHIIGSLANAMVLADRATIDLMQNGTVIDTGTSFKQNPNADILKKQQTTINDCFKQLRMTPTARKMIQIELSEDDGDPLSDFLDGLNKKAP